MVCDELGTRWCARNTVCGCRIIFLLLRSNRSCSGGRFDYCRFEPSVMVKIKSKKNWTANGFSTQNFRQRYTLALGGHGGAWRHPSHWALLKNLSLPVPQTGLRLVTLIFCLSGLKSSKHETA